MRRPAHLLALCGLTLALAGCGGSSGAATGHIPPLRTDSPTPTPSAAMPSAEPSTSEPAGPTPILPPVSPSAPTSSPSPSTSTSVGPGAVSATDVEAAVRAYYRAAAEALRDNDIAGYAAAVTSDCACLPAFRKLVDQHRAQGWRLIGAEVFDIRVDIRTRTKSLANAVVIYSERPAKVLDRGGKVIGTDPGLTDAQDSLFISRVGARLQVATVLHLRTR